jgi:hypothetical protein
MLSFRRTSRQNGFIIGILRRPGCLGLLLLVGGLGGGGQMIYTSLSNRQPLSITVEDYITQKPSAKWVELTHAKASILESASIGLLGSVEELYIPVRPREQEIEGPISILLKTKSPGLLQFITQLRKAKDEQAGNEIIAQHLDYVRGPEVIKGLVQSGFETDSKARRKLNSLEMNLSNDFIIVEDGKQPSIIEGLMVLLIGLVGGGMLTFFAFRSGSKTSAAPPSQLASGGPPPLPPS